MAVARADLPQIFHAAEQAHHDAFAATGGPDPERPDWYSRYLALPLCHLLDSTVPPDVIAAALRTIENERQRAAPASEWTAYYADWFLGRYVPRVDAEATKTP